jgi:hypothetical protein
MNIADHSIFSSYREVLLEHLFTGELMRHLWRNGVVRVEVLKPQVDDSGYDLVLEANGCVRHVQLKSSYADARTARINVSLGLAEKPSGCVVWLWFNPSTLDLGPYFWFGSPPGEPLPDLNGYSVGRHTKGNKEGVKLERPNVRVIPKGDFERVNSMAEIAERLFGPLKPA